MRSLLSVCVSLSVSVYLSPAIIRLLRLMRAPLRLSMYAP
jgi:hypothetical protein